MSAKNHGPVQIYYSNNPEENRIIPSSREEFLFPSLEIWIEMDRKGHQAGRQATFVWLSGTHPSIPVATKFLPPHRRNRNQKAKAPAPQQAGNNKKSELEAKAER